MVVIPPGNAVFTTISLPQTRAWTGAEVPFPSFLAAVVNSAYMASTSCTSDALCGTNVANSAVVTVLAFLAARLAHPALVQRLRR
jgi:hypothetical protein